MSGALAFAADSAGEGSPAGQPRSPEAILFESHASHDDLAELRSTSMAALAAPETRIVLVRDGAAPARYDVLSRHLLPMSTRYGSLVSLRSVILDAGCRTLHRLGILLQT